MPQQNRDTPSDEKPASNGAEERAETSLHKNTDSVVGSVDAEGSSDYGSYLLTKGKRRRLVKHATDFTVDSKESALEWISKVADLTVQQVAANVTRFSTQNEKVRDELMTVVRTKAVAHHIYELEDQNQEIVIDDRILLAFHQDSLDALARIKEKYHLDEVVETDSVTGVRSLAKIGDAYLLRITDETRRNPVQVANEIAQEDNKDVASCIPQIFIPIQRRRPLRVGSGGDTLERARERDEPAAASDATGSSTAKTVEDLFERQWSLVGKINNDDDVSESAGINAPKAWDVTKGDSNVVVAVIDDGFDLRHPAFEPAVNSRRISTELIEDFIDGRAPEPDSDDFHGTCVASIILAAITEPEGSEAPRSMRGIAPQCKLLSIRIDMKEPLVSQTMMLKALRLASQKADVVNCSIEAAPSKVNLLDDAMEKFRDEVAAMTSSGGRRPGKKGLVIVFSAGNDDAPTHLTAADNKKGIKFVRHGFPRSQFDQIEPGVEVFSFFPRIPGVIVVSAVSSLNRKSGYSNWGPHITIAAPSDNSHDLFPKDPTTIAGLSDEVRTMFEGEYRGLGLVAAINRPGIGFAFKPIAMKDNPLTPFGESDYTVDFGGTSGAAPIVTGIVALMLSVNPTLTAAEVVEILQSTADRIGLVPTPDSPNDPNLQGLGGDFDGKGRSRFFGTGKVNAARAVEKARSLLPS